MAGALRETITATTTLNELLAALVTALALIV
jgi:hypothetical protein